MNIYHARKFLIELLKCSGIIIPMCMSGCGLLPKNATEWVKPNYPSMVWPDRPEEPRIEFRQVIRDPRDLGVEKGFFTKLVDWIFGDSEIAIIKPMSVASLNDGTVFIADPGAGGVHRIDRVNNEHDLIMLKGEIALATPISLATDGENLFVSDSTLGIFVVGHGDDHVEQIKFDILPVRASGIAYSRKTKRFYVVDTGDHSVKIYENNKLVRTIGKRGNQPGEFNFPTLAWLDKNETLYITDSLNFRIQMFSPDGEFLREFGERGAGTGTQLRPKGVATDKYGHIYVVDSLFHSVQVFNQIGEFLLNFGIQGANYGEFWLPTGIFIDERDGVTIYIADSFNRRVQVFRYIGGEA